MILDFLRRRSKPAAPTQRSRLTDNAPATIYAIGDIHGCLDELKRLMAAIAADAADFSGRKLLVLLGDYVDRGPNSAAVLDWLCASPPAGFERVALAGNHEAMMLEFIRDPRPDAAWLTFGGTDTLRSYGIDPDTFVRARPRDRLAMIAALIPPEHIDLLDALPSVLVTPDAVFVHAGLRPDLPLAAQDDEDLLWIREPFLSQPTSDGRLVVHGHTPGVEPVVTGHRICIDTGAYATGVLTAARMRGTGVAFIDTRLQRDAGVAVLK